jgi:cytochrome o ubiquinol oxidase subunit 2
MSTSLRRHRCIRLAALAALALPLAGCNTIVLHPHGYIAEQQAHLIVTATLLMLLIIVPTMVLTAVFARRYRASNTQASYMPEWDSSLPIGLAMWGAPLLVISILGTITWKSTHALDPYRPLDRIDAQRAIPAGMKPLVVGVVAMDWKWLFVYGEQGIATVNELAVPVDRPVEFRITASSVMNAFYVPAMAGMVYAMPGMQTPMHAVLNRPGSYEGLSANYSGAGFSDMHFRVLGLAEGDFASWVESVRQGGGALTRDGYLQLERPSSKEPVRRYAKVDEGLYEAVLNRCVEPGKMCLHDMMAIDSAGGSGKGSVVGVRQQSRADGSTRPVVAALCTPDNPLGLPRPIP